MQVVTPLVDGHMGYTVVSQEDQLKPVLEQMGIGRYVIPMLVNVSNGELDRNESNEINHWVALIVNTANKGIYYIDPMGNEPSQQVANIIRNIFGFDIQINNVFDKNHHPQVSGNNDDCGPFLVETLRMLAVEKKRPQEVRAAMAKGSVEESKEYGQELRKIQKDQLDQLQFNFNLKAAAERTENKDHDSDPDNDAGVGVPSTNNQESMMKKEQEAERGSYDEPLSKLISSRANFIIRPLIKKFLEQFPEADRNKIDIWMGKKYIEVKANKNQKISADTITDIMDTASQEFKIESSFQSLEKEKSNNFAEIEESNSEELEEPKPISFRS
jgi:ribosomal 50S subunit-associated protein YjgA (DUF615 family)